MSRRSGPVGPAELRPTPQAPVNGNPASPQAIEQKATIKGSAQIVATGSVNNNTYNYYIVNLGLDPAVAQVLPALIKLLINTHDAPALIHEAADACDAPLPSEPGMDVPKLLTQRAGLLPQPGQLPPLIEVSEYARQQATDPGGRAEFASIGERWAAEVPEGRPLLDNHRRAAERKSAGGDPPAHPCLLVMVSPDRSGGDGYQASLVLFRNESNGEQLPGIDMCVPLGGIQSWLKESLPGVLRTVKDSSLLVEFVVPRELLNTGFDQWYVPDRPGRLYQLGTRYPVVVRDLERMTMENDLWEYRWKLLCEYAIAPAEAVRWVDPRANESFSSLDASLRREKEHGRVCLALLPAPSASGVIAEFLDAGLSAGLPAVIWLRQPGAAEDSGEWDRDYLATAVNSAELRALPRKVLDLRQAAEAEQQPAEHPGRQLSLLWDNPDRRWVPPPLMEPVAAPVGPGGDQ